MITITTHLELLGKKVRDRVTKTTGVVTSISFDLFGCIQAILNPGMDKDGKQRDSLWMDVSRLEVLDKKPVMTPPNFNAGPIAEGKQGAAEKPPNSRY